MSLPYLKVSATSSRIKNINSFHGTHVLILISGHPYAISKSGLLVHCSLSWNLNVNARWVSRLLSYWLGKLNRGETELSYIYRHCWRKK